MKTYLVGGAVRDALSGREAHDRDWCITGAAASEVLARKCFRQVGRDFPVFIHQGSGEEYSLARRLVFNEKTGLWDSSFAPDIDITEDLSHRDLTINAMAQDKSGTLIDPVGGAADLKAKVLRHVGESFFADSLRILRLARFFAVLEGFSVAPETIAAIKSESRHLPGLPPVPPERVFKELETVLEKAARPSRFFKLLDSTGTLAHFFPAIFALKNVPQAQKYHSEGDVFTHTMMVLDACAALTRKPVVRFAAITHDLGKATTPKDILPAHHGHESRGEKLAQKFAHTIKASANYGKFASLCARWHMVAHRADELKPATFVRLFSALNAWQQPHLLDDFLTLCHSDRIGRNTGEFVDYPKAGLIRTAFAAACRLRANDVCDDINNAAPQTVGQKLQNARVTAIKTAVEKWKARES